MAIFAALARHSLAVERAATRPRRAAGIVATACAHRCVVRAAMAAVLRGICLGRRARRLLPEPARPTSRLVDWAGGIVAWRLPEAWAHPFAPLVKNLPILALICHLARRIP